MEVACILILKKKNGNVKIQSLYSDIDLELAGVSRCLIPEGQRHINLNYKRLLVCVYGSQRAIFTKTLF